ncbi:hypothetical protein [Prescottella subtropica]|uniref:hypothetical protein n=1 Tax=Prescottella subtropica TaxID=2545757 RepID=UPI0010F711B9|nr:hypothetical protein [Prescottella subtropica]
MDRLTVVDEIFLRRHRGYGLPIVMQGLWRTADALDTDAAPLLASVHDVLAGGALGRRVVRSRVPGARPRWEPSTDTLPLRYDTEPVDDVVAWADTQTGVDVDPGRGPGWVLAAAPVRGGGTVISLVCSHVVADARGLVAAVDAALTGREPAPTPPRTSDVADAARILRRVVFGGALASLALLPSARRRRELRAFAAAASPAGPARTVTGTATAIVDVDAAVWDTVAGADGGTPNGLFLSVVTGIADAAGVPMPLHVSVPVDARDSAGTSNAVVMTDVVVTPNDSLTEIRRSCREAFTRTPMGAPSGFPEETVHLLPDRLAHRLTSGAGERDALCSNVGRLPDSLATLGPYRTTGVATRAVHPGLSPQRPARTTTRLSAYLCRCGGTYTLSLVALDLEAFGSGAALRDLAVDRLAARGLTARPW